MSERCEAVVDVTGGDGTAPRLIKCGKPAKIYGMAALCDECAQAILHPEEVPSSPDTPPGTNLYGL